MVRFLLVVCALCVFSFGCKKKESEFIIPADTFRKILYDFHLADGLYTINYSTISLHNDTMNFYNDILKTYGYSFAQFDSTLAYYAEDPEKFDKIYAQIVTRFNKLEHESEQLTMMADSFANLYTGKKQWILPNDGPSKRIPFDIAVKDSNEYTIYVFAKKSADDASKNLRITAFYYYKDSATNEEHMDYFPEITYESGKRFTLYTTSKFLSNKKVKRLRGWILNYDKPSELVHRDVVVKLIAIRQNHAVRTL
jgi:hypothetical protein